MRDLRRAYTPTISKYAQHPQRLADYGAGTGRTVITADVALTGRCNLSCAYCLVRERDQWADIGFHRLLTYLEELCARGLKTVILTGGGEPTLHEQTNPLLRWLHGKGVRVGLITNGTCLERVTEWEAVAWVRISLNEAPLARPPVPKGCTVGLSVILNGSASSSPEVTAKLKKARDAAKELQADYVRVMADGRRDRPAQQATWKAATSALGDERFVFQGAIYRAPRANVCHRAYFRPYLSEVDGGTIFPCGIVPFQGEDDKFGEKHAIGPAEDIGRFMDGEIATVVPWRDCPRCPCADTVEWLAEFKTPVLHPDFV